MEKKTKFIRETSNAIIIDKLKEGLSIKETIKFFKDQEPKNYIEKRIIKRSVCILYGYIMVQQGKFYNNRLVSLLDYLQKGENGL